MALADPTTFYLTADEYEAQTTVPTLVSSLTSDQVNALLLETMGEIDGYLGGGWTPLDDEQEFTFPRYQDTDGDGNPVIPRPVALATRLIADAILQKRQGDLLPHEVESEGNLGHTYSRRKRTSEAPLGLEHWPPAVFIHLDKVMPKGGSFGVQDECLID